MENTQSAERTYLKYFKFMFWLPIVLVILLGLAFTICSIWEPVAATYNGDYYGYWYSLFGVTFGLWACLLWLIEGAIVCLIVYFLSKFLTSFFILHIIYQQRMITLLKGDVEEDLNQYSIKTTKQENPPDDDQPKPQSDNKTPPYYYDW